MITAETELSDGRDDDTDSLRMNDADAGEVEMMKKEMISEK